MEKESIFVSYAWGGSLEKKEWLRNQVVASLRHPDYSLFWDRDSIPYGLQTIDEVINQALAARPIVVLCFCDEDYCKAATKIDSGLSKELNSIAQIISQDSVRVVPIILQEECKSILPSLFRGRPYLDLSELHRKKLFLGKAILSLVLGATQTEIISQVEKQIQLEELREKANTHFKFNSLTFHGNARTHEVLNDNGQPLFPPIWMQESSNWSYLFSDESTDFNPQKGVWHWDHWTPSRGMCALGTAICTEFFPGNTGDADIAALEQCGKILARKEISMIKKTEPFILDSDRLIQILLSDPEGEVSVARLLS
jgi:hypothetical protein